MKLLLTLLFFFSNLCFSQEMLSPCAQIIGSYLHESVKVKASDNGDFFVRIHAVEDKMQAIIYAWNKNIYEVKNIHTLDYSIMPREIFINNTGTLVIIGRSGNYSNKPDQISIYSINEGLIKVIESVEINYTKNNMSCAPLNRWICRSIDYTIEIDNSNINLLTLDNHEVDINLSTGLFEKNESDYSCG